MNQTNRWIACLVMAVALAGSQLALAQAPGPPRPFADDTLRARWRTWLAERDRLHVVHVESRWRPVPFATERRCDFELRFEHEDAVLEGAAAREIAAFLADQLTRPAGPVKSWCPDDSSAGSDALTIDFGAAGDSLRVEYDPQRGSLAVTDRVGRHWFAAVDSSEARLLVLLARALPDDLRLPEVRACVAASRRTDPPREPAFGTYVQVETLPEILERQLPEYPAAAAAAGVEASIHVRALVGTDGRVVRTLLEYISKEAHPFQGSAVRAIENYRFKPATLGGRPVAVWVAVPTRFRLR
ncbi:MAG: energy transducer TonB [Candidatus Eisenbacteria bacterium]